MIYAIPGRKPRARNKGRVMKKLLTENNLFKIKLLRNILIAALVLVTLLSLYNIFFIYPAFTELLIKSTKTDAVRATRHLATSVFDQYSEITQDVFRQPFVREVQIFKKDFDLLKLKIYSAEGQSIFSTDPHDRNVNKAHFHEVIAKGQVYANIVAKNRKSLEGQTVTSDVVETYVPIMKDDAFLGAFEIYYDITNRKKQLDNLSLRSNIVLAVLTVVLLFAIIVLFFKENKNTDERRRAETALRKSEEKLAGILNAMPDPIIVVDGNINIIWSNLAAPAFFGPDLVGRHCCKEFNAFRKPGISNYVERCFADGQSHEYEAEIQCVDGVRKTFWCTVSAATGADDGTPKTIIVVYRDVTEKKLLEAETARACQLASVGELAAGVAHEINNPINGIINCAQMLIDEEGISGEQHEISQRIFKAGKRIAMIVRNLLSFARDHEEDLKPVHIQRIISDSLDLTAAQLRNDGIDLKVDIPNEIPMIKARIHQMQQVFLNLISNARYALNQKFTVPHEDKVLEIRGTTVNDNGRKYVRLVFLDHGPGITADDLDRICDPFFSTKPIGEGTGLGLSVSHAILKDHGGRLSFKSKEGQYAKITIHLPVV